MIIENDYIKFTYYTSGVNYCPESKTEITIGNDSSLSEIVEKFEQFLKASGFLCDKKTIIISEK